MQIQLTLKFLISVLNVIFNVHDVTPALNVKMHAALNRSGEFLSMFDGTMWNGNRHTCPTRLLKLKMLFYWFIVYLQYQNNYGLI